MNTKSSPSRYRNCMSLRSTMASPTLTPALKVRSITAPVLTFRSFVRTNAPPFPGFTCWNSMTWKRLPSRSRVIPRFRSLVDTLMFSDVLLPAGALQHEELFGGPRDDAAPLRGDHHHVLDPHPAEPSHVHPGLHGHHRGLGQHVGGADPERGRSEERRVGKECRSRWSPY